MERLKIETQSLVKSLMAKMDSSFFAKAKSLKEIPEFPVEFNEQAARLDSEFSRFENGGVSAKLRESAFDESATVGLLVAWTQFARQLKTGQVGEAAGTLTKALARKPKSIPPASAAIWANAEGWQSAYTKGAEQYHAHVKKARALAGLKKTSEAIRELENALAIIGDASLTEEIRTLRVQSLGL